MRYPIEIIINKPIAKVIELFDNPDYLKEWQPGLVSFEPLSGTPGQPGAKSKLLFKMNGKDVEMIETILTHNLPAEFSATYEAPGVFNVVRNYFTEIDESSTKYTTDNEFQFTNLVMKVIGFFMASSFKKTSLEYQENFKKFVESQS
jgi:hypothetical protein